MRSCSGSDRDQTQRTGNHYNKSHLYNDETFAWFWFFSEVEKPGGDPSKMLREGAWVQLSSCPISPLLPSWFSPHTSQETVCCFYWQESKLEPCDFVIRKCYYISKTHTVCEAHYTTQRADWKPVHGVSRHPSQLLVDLNRYLYSEKLACWCLYLLSYSIECI